MILSYGLVKKMPSKSHETIPFKMDLGIVRKSNASRHSGELFKHIGIDIMLLANLFSNKRCIAQCTDI
jgi:hypothetical protein